MKRVKKLLPDKYYLDKYFFPLKDKLINEVTKNENKYTNLDGYQKNLIAGIVGDTLYAIKPKYNTKTKKFY